MYSYFYDGDVPKYSHSTKQIPYISEVYSDTNPRLYKRQLLIDSIVKWKDEPYGFHKELYQDEIEDNHYTQNSKTIATNYDIYQELMDGLVDILNKHGKTVSNFDQLEEDVMYYLYNIMI